MVARVARSSSAGKYTSSPQTCFSFPRSGYKLTRSSELTHAAKLATVKGNAKMSIFPDPTAPSPVGRFANRATIRARIPAIRLSVSSPSSPFPPIL